MNTFGYMAIVKICRVYLAQVSKRPVHFKLLKITFCYFPTCLLSSKASGSIKTGGLVFEDSNYNATNLTWSGKHLQIMNPFQPQYQIQYQNADGQTLVMEGGGGSTGLGAPFSVSSKPVRHLQKCTLCLLVTIEERLHPPACLLSVLIS